MSDRLFKKASFEDELYSSMEKQLIANQTETKHGLKKVAKAIDYLNAAASIFDQAGMLEESEEITKILQGLVGKND